jgi:lysophospholipase L1-like esterase
MYWNNVESMLWRIAKVGVVSSNLIARSSVSIGMTLPAGAGLPRGQRAGIVGRCPMLRIMSLAFVLFFCLSPCVRAQTPPPPPGMVEHPCPDTPPWPAQPLAEPGGAPMRYDPDRVATYIAMMNEQKLRDWAWLCRYQPENAALAAARVVFMGDSITEAWARCDPAFFSNGNVDRGIGGQTSPQMLLRFQQDVIALRPRIVHIMAGTNDIAGNTGPNSADDFKNNIRAMVTLARANRIKVILASIPPANRFPWRPDIAPSPQIIALNHWLAAYAAEQRVVYADYYSVLVGTGGELNPAYTYDGVHPATAGYQAMRTVTERAIAAAERSRQR